MAGQVRTIYSDAAKQNAVFPRTKISGVSDNNDVGLQSILDNKQSLLVSGTNIKTVNNTSLLGSGNITVGGDTNVIETVKVNNTPLTPDVNKAVNIDLSSYATETYVQNYVNSLDAREVEY